MGIRSQKNPKPTRAVSEFSRINEAKSPDPAPAGTQSLLALCKRLEFCPHDISANLDARGHYNIELNEEFPFNIRLFHFSTQHHTRGGTWHERLELFLPLDGPAILQMGQDQVSLNPLDLLVVDNLKLHQVVDFPGFDTRVVVISFLPEFVYSLGSPSHDYAFLMPFYMKLEGRPHALRAGSPDAGPVYEVMSKLLSCYFNPTDRLFFQAGCKAYLLELLYFLTRHFPSASMLKREFMRQQQRSLRLRPLFEHIRTHYSERLTVNAAARRVGMSVPQFMRLFKQVSGMTLVAYLNHVRLSNAARLLKETQRSIAEISAEVGFSDQSYFDKRFKRAFGVSPKEHRHQHLSK